MVSKTHESLAAEATAYLTNSAGAVGGFNGIQQEIRRQAACLVEWARERGVPAKFFIESTQDKIAAGEA